MISPQALVEGLKRRNAVFFAGVPDSLLRHFCAYLGEHCGTNHIIAANEGNAVALAMGHYLATGAVPVVYMQNSGLGNAVNPLTSLADPEVYGIPMLLIVGWRGEPGQKDEPQHVKQGRITPGQLDLLEIPYRLLEPDSNLDDTLDALFLLMDERLAPAALLVRNGAFEAYPGLPAPPRPSALTREQALRQLLLLVEPSDILVSTTGKTSRELYELRVERSEPQQDFLTVGGMGHTSSIALGVALGQPDKRVICLDGDGSLLMHLGAMPIIGSRRPPNLVHVLLNNGAHESVGGQPTVADSVDFHALAMACGYAGYHRINDAESLTGAWAGVTGAGGPVLLEVIVQLGSRANLGRPKSAPSENKDAFMNHARGKETI